jgi:hypothetical protein
MPISKEMKNRIGVVTQIAETTFHYGYIPLILYLGKEILIYTCLNLSLRSYASVLLLKTESIECLFPSLFRISKGRGAWNASADIIEVSRPIIVIFRDRNWKND